VKTVKAVSMKLSHRQWHLDRTIIFWAKTSKKSTYPEQKNMAMQC